LVDADDAIGVTRAHQTAQLGLLQAQPTRNGGHHPGVGELQFGRVQLGLVGLHRALQLAHQGLLRFDLLACNRVLFQQALVAL